MVIIYVRFLMKDSYPKLCGFLYHS